MAHDEQKQLLFKSVSCLRSAQVKLMQASRSSNDPVVLAKINNEYSQLDSFLTQTLHCIAVDDDQIFADSTGALKSQATVLQSEEEEFKAVVAKVDTAAEIVACIAEAVSLIAKL
jgi:hypothetical protein